MQSPAFNSALAIFRVSGEAWKTLKRAEDVAAYVLDGVRSARRDDAERLEASSIKQAA